jgi:hypothetical protein
VEQRDLVRAQALKTFEEVSVLLDQRIYRMRLVHWAARRLALGTSDMVELQARKADYRSMLWQWNDNVNRIHALVQTYFGEPSRTRLRSELYDTFEAIGEELEQFVREVSRKDRGEVRVRSIGGRLNDLAERVYEFDISLLQAFPNDRLGPSAPQGDTLDVSIRPLQLRFGSDGRRVRDLQLALVRETAIELTIDGHFGPATELALMEFQRAHNMAADGVPGPETMSALNLGA